MTKFSDNDSPSLLFTEQGSTPTTPAASHQRLFIRTSDHVLCYVNSSGTVTAVGSSASGSITSSGYTQNTAKLLGRTTGSAGAIEEITVGSGLTLSAGSLTASGGSGVTKSFLGYNTAGGSQETWTTRRQFCKAFTPGANGTAISVEGYLRPSTDNIDALHFAIMADNAGAPGVLLGGNSMASIYLSNSSSMPGASRWFSSPVSVDLTSGTQYWASIMASGTLFDIAYDGSGSDQYFTPSLSTVTGAYPTAWAITTGSRKYSIRIGFLS